MDYREALEASKRSGNRFRDREDAERENVLEVTRDVCPQKKGTILRIFIPAGAEMLSVIGHENTSLLLQRGRNVLRNCPASYNIPAPCQYRGTN